MSFQFALPQSLDALVGSALIVLPIALVLIDLLVFPPILESRRLLKDVDITSLLVRQVVSLGTLKAHRLHVSLDSILSARYLHYIKGSRNGLVISHFISDGKQGSRAGALGQALLAKLTQVSPADGQRLRDQLDQVGEQKAGEILRLRLKVPREQYRRFAIDYIFILLLEEGPSVGSVKVIGNGIAEVLSLAKRCKIAALVVPCLGYNWEDKNSVAFDHIFRSFFNSLPRGGAPRDFYLSLYGGWPTFVLQEAVKSLNASWGRQVLAGQFYRGDLRLTLIALSVCLLASSFSASITLKNFAVIATSFIALSLGAKQITNHLTREYNATLRFWIHVVVLIVLAVGFPIFVDWNPRSILDGH